MADPQHDVLRLVDAHHHLWDLGVGSYPWLQRPPDETETGSADVGLRRNYLVADFLEDAAGLPLLGSVHVEAAADPRDPLAETRWLQETADVDGFPTAIVAHAFLERDDVSEQLAAHATAPALRGIRQMLDLDPWTGESTETALLTDPAWLEGLRRLGPLGLVFDLQVLPSQLGLAADVAERTGEVTFVLNHGGYHVPGSEDAERLWQRGIAAIARCPNVVVKASGYDTVDPSWPQDGVDRFLGTLIDAFGPDRVMFASNFPVDGRSITYSRLVEMDRQALRHLDADDRDRFFYRNAVRTYQPIVGKGVDHEESNV